MPLKMATRGVSSKLQAPSCSEENGLEHFLATDCDPFSSDGSASLLNESFCQLLSGFSLPENSHIVTASCPPYPHPSNEHDTENNTKQKKRKAHCSVDKVQHAKSEWQDASSDTAKSPAKKNENEEKGVHAHMRAKRGHATSSHSLAERVRRERISERMKLLQDLVPGCDKITGKAVMLDEIINYVRSLQRQVEFLAMKLASVHPELSMDMDHITSRDILLSRNQTPAIPWYNAGISPSNAELMQAGLAIPITINPGELFRTNPSQTPNMSLMPNLSDAELQKSIQMGFISNPSRTY